MKKQLSFGTRLGSAALRLVAPLSLFAIAFPASTAVADDYCEEVSAWSAPWSSFEDEVMRLVNQRRSAGASCGTAVQSPAGPLVLEPKLRCAARKHAKDMGTSNNFRPTGSDGSTFSQRIKSAGYKSSSVGENIIAGHATPAAVVDAWMASPKHCISMMNPNFKHVGVGYFNSEASTYRNYWVMSFGNP